MRISHNLMAFNAQYNLKTVTSKKAKEAEKLASGYRINRAADDAAGLAISEKMRRLIRGLNQGSENASDGISWSQSGDGALNEAHDIIHRMTELTIYSLNDTLSKEDRFALEAEFEQLQSELDRVATTTRFNDINIFEQHEIPYYQCEGGVKWDPHQMHVVTAGQNDLIFTYREAEGDAQKTVTITVPPGEYTTQELIDEIDDITTALNATTGVDLIVEFDKEGYCNANLEGGEVIDSITGDMSYLFYDMFRGGGYGALIGTTSFSNDVIKMSIVTGQNDYMKFTIENLDGTTMVKEITIPQGGYSRPELIDYLNSQLTDTTVKATAYGSGIRLASDEAIVTGFKGNMFKIDSTKPIYDSVFYDNVKYGRVTQTSAEFIGGYVLTTNSKDEEHRYYRIVAGQNDQLTLQPSGCQNPVTITIPDDEYTAAEMVGKLKDLLQAHGITNLEVEVISKDNFQGIKITNTEKGVDSQINMDATSSAYDTLFVNKIYNSYVQTVYPVNETKADKDAVFGGSKNLDDSVPITITAGSNDQFMLSINGGTASTITLSAGTYNSAEVIRQEIDNQLNGAGATVGYKGKLDVTLQDGKIILTGVTSEKVNSIVVEASGSNQGFETIFQGYKVVKYTEIAEGNPATLNTSYNPQTDTIPDGSKMKITIDGTDYWVDIPVGNPSTDDIEKAIKVAIPGSTTEVLNKFSYTEATGDTQPRDFGTPAEGTTTVTSWSGSKTGTSNKVEGEVAVKDSKPAVLTIGVELKDSMVVDDSNNVITLTMNDSSIHPKTVAIVLEPYKTYTKDSLVTELQTKIDAAFGTAFGGAIVSLSADGKNLVLTSRLGEYDDGAASYIQCSTANSSFLQELNTRKTAAVWKSNRALNSNITITDASNEFKFKFTENGTTREIVILLDAKTYTAAELAAAIDTKLEGSGVGASLSGGALCLTSEEKGSGIIIDYKTSAGGSSAEAMFGPLLVETAASIVTNRDTQTTISIKDGSDGSLANNVFNITVNGNNYSVQLVAGDYNRSSFVEMLNNCLKDTNNNVPAEAYLSGGKLAYRTTDVGSGVRISMSYDAGGSSMEAIYGKTTITYPAIKAVFGSDGKLSLSTPTAPDANIKVDSNYGGPFQTHKEETKKVDITSEAGYHSDKYAYIQGVSLNGNVTIDQWNDDLRFDFYDEGSPKTVEIQLEHKEYTYDELALRLQTLIDDKLGTDRLKVTVDANGVRLQAVKPGSKNTFSTVFYGDFYYKVIGKATLQTSSEKPVANEGKQYVDSAYTVGRKDVQSVTTRIQAGISDELKLELTYGNNVYKLNMKLDEGYYSSDQLKAHLQQKVNEQLVANGLPANLIVVGIGDINTGVSGSNDDRALNFSLSKTIQAPSEGQFIIDGVSGNAAFEIFYQTDGSLEQAYITGTKDVSNGVTIPAGEEDLTFEVDGTTYSITIPANDYTADEIVAEINNALQGVNAPIKAEVVEGKLRIKHKKMGEHDIKNPTGSAVNNIFHSENGIKEPKTDRYVKLSSSTEESDKIKLDTPVFNTCFMKINSVCISQEKYARKALERINDALQYISNIRSSFGSTQNRLEHALRNNQNTAENLQAAESQIRDMDMAKGMVALSNHNIIEQAGQAMLAQANQLQQGVLALLR